ncbi:glucosidase 2 subunit beta [Eurytemora carolleeae]|uniref:glucosidase 2 subunit beta n=1 Tax=Eurytemora carolleeae TaxID=1294199 RepID=UPI000C782CEE|nr:glucosidase 2 subunit beta [Eurytemora carolleeae]|eukprot:XP_023321352.1 glucosidase 2 subunit beta-like [Eurytemora affinis]
MCPLLIFLLICSGVESIRPRGVRVELASFYNPADEFSCLDGSGTIPFIQVNDDYCDCDDGSDEPGTSACPNGKFYCDNKGHNPLLIPSSRVNDGICDCCDGSDEWEAGSACEDTCLELGRAAREEAEAQAKIALQGFRIKQDMINEGKVLQDERAGKVADKEMMKLQLESQKEAVRLEKEAAEAPEKEALDFYRQLEEEENKKKEEEDKKKKDEEAEQYFLALDLDKDGYISRVELQTRTGLDTNKDGEVSEDEVNFFLAGHEQFDLEIFKTTGFTLLKPYLDLEQQNSEPESASNTESSDDTESVSVPTPEDPQVYDPWRANQAKEEEGIEAGEDEYDDDEDDKDDVDYDISDSPPADSSTHKPQVEDKYDEKTRGLIAAAEEIRKKYQDVERQLNDIDRDIKNIKEVMEKDFGYENEFVVLSGQCFEYTDNEYVYKMCPFDSASQRSKNGGGETRLGSWGEWLGSQENRYTQMKFTGGAQCWNGPQRSATIILHCGTENQLTAVSEPNRCEYEMHFVTPAACHNPSSTHDEL